MEVILKLTNACHFCISTNVLEPELPTLQCVYLTKVRLISVTCCLSQTRRMGSTKDVKPGLTDLLVLSQRCSAILRVKMCWSVSLAIQSNFSRVFQNQAMSIDKGLFSDELTEFGRRHVFVYCELLSIMKHCNT